MAYLKELLIAVSIPYYILSSYSQPSSKMNSYLNRFRKNIKESSIYEISQEDTFKESQENSITSEKQSLKIYQAGEQQMSQEEQLKECYFYTPRKALCKVTFEYESKEECIQIEENMTLREITMKLISKIATSYHSQEASGFQQEELAVLEHEIKDKLNNILISNLDHNPDADIWRKKMREVIASGENQQLTQMQKVRPSHSESKLRYFGYVSGKVDQDTDSLRELEKQNKYHEQYSKIKQVHDFLNQNSSLQHCQSEPKINLYQKFIKNQAQRQQILHQTEEDKYFHQLNQCTFHPKIKNIKDIKDNFFNSSNSHPSNQVYQENNKSFKFDHKTISTKQKFNVFDKLYHEAIIKRKKKQQLISEIQRQKQKKLSCMKFIPEINSCSKQIIRLKHEIEDNPQEFQHQKSPKSLDNIQLQRLFKEIQNNAFFNKQCTFHPVICQKSKRITSMLPNFEERLKQYQDNASSKDKQIAKSQDKKNIIKNISKKLKTTSSSQETEQSFMINQKRDFITKEVKELNQKQNIPMKKNDFKKKYTKKKQSPFTPTMKVKRQRIVLEDNIQKIQKKNRKKTPLKEKQINVNSKQNLVNKSNKKNVQKQITNSLLQNLSFISDIQNQNSSDFTQKKQASEIKLSTKQSRSQELYNQRKRLIFQSIFYFLLPKNEQDTEEIEKFEVNHACIDKNIFLPKHILDLFEPMAEEMKQLNVGLDKEQFIWSMNMMFAALSTNEKGSLLAWGLKLMPENQKGQI